jgi:hypothetical protein
MLVLSGVFNTRILVATNYMEGQTNITIWQQSSTVIKLGFSLFKYAPIFLLLKEKKSLFLFYDDVELKHINKATVKFSKIQQSSYNNKYSNNDL